MLHKQGANLWLDLLFGTETKPSSFYVAVLKSAASYDDTGADLDEPSGGDYARVEVVNDGTAFTSASDGTTRNDEEIVFPTATASWGTVRHWALLDAATDGDLIVSGRISSRTVTSGRTLRIPISDLTIKAR